MPQRTSEMKVVLLRKILQDFDHLVPTASSQDRELGHKKWEGGFVWSVVKHPDS